MAVSANKSLVASIASATSLEAYSTSFERAILSHLKDEGTHPAEMIDARVIQDLQRDMTVFSCRCMACERVWDLALPVHWSMGWDEVIGKISDWTKIIVGTLCFKFQQRAELAEWITELVAAADPYGIAYGRLLQLATEEHLCAASDVDVALSGLGFIHHWHPGMINAVDMFDSTYRLKDGTFVPGGPKIILPYNHPLKGARK